MFGLWFSLKVHGLQIGAPFLSGVFLVLVFSEPVIFRKLYHIFLASVGTFSGSFLFYFSVPYFGLACDHGNSFLCLEEEEREGYWIDVRTVFNVKITTTTSLNRCNSLGRV